MRWNVQNVNIVRRLIGSFNNGVLPAAPVSHAQFRSYMRDFRDAAEAYFDAPVSLQTRVSKGCPQYSTWGSSDTVRSDSEHNAAIETLRTFSLDNVTQDVWAQAAYAECELRVPGDKVQEYAVGRATFLGLAPYSAQFEFSPLYQDSSRVMEFVSELAARQAASFSGTSISDGRTENAYVRVGKGLDVI